MTGRHALWVLVGAMLLVSLLAAACSSDGDSGDGGDAEAVPAVADDGADAPEAADDGPYALKQTFDLGIELTSLVFDRIRRIPVKHACVTRESYNRKLATFLYGEDTSPPLEWSGVPEGARSLALVVDSDEEPGEPWVHWVIWGLPPDAAALAEAVPTTTEVASLGPNVRQGVNDRNQIGYSGPCPRPATESSGWKYKTQVIGKVLFEYSFHLYALDTDLDLGPDATKNDLLRAMDGHILSAGQLTTEMSAEIKGR